MKLWFKIVVLLFCLNSFAQEKDVYNDGLIKFMDKDFESALIDFKEVLKSTPENFDAHYYTGVCHIKLGNYKVAIVHFDKAVELNPEYSRAYYNRGVAKFHIRDSLNGCLDFKKALKLDPNYDEAIKSINEFCK